MSWRPGGPSFSVFPYPVVDATRKDARCKDCGYNCFGHYVTDLTKYLALYFQGKAIRSPPPSQILQDYNKTKKPFWGMISRTLLANVFSLPKKLRSGWNTFIKSLKTGGRELKKLKLLAEKSR